MNLFNLQELAVPRDKLISYFRKADADKNSCVSRSELREIKKIEPPVAALIEESFKKRSWWRYPFSLKYEEYQRSYLGIAQFSKEDLRLSELIEESGPYTYADGTKNSDTDTTQVTLKTRSGNEIIFSHDVKDYKDTLTLRRNQTRWWELNSTKKYFVYQDAFARKFRDIYEHHLKNDRLESLSDVWAGEYEEGMKAKWNGENFALVLNAVRKSPANLKFIKPAFFNREQYLALIKAGAQKNPESVIQMLSQNIKKEFWEFSGNRQLIQEMMQGTPALAEKILELIPDQFRGDYSLNSQ